MFRRSPSLLLRVLVLSTALALQAAAQDLPDLQSWLSRPISPGTVAYLVNYALSDPLVGRLAAALRDPRSDVRAAAARVAFVLGANGLATVAGEALKTESDVEAAIEQARIVAYFSDSDPLLLDAWKRLGADSGAEVLFALAGARGVSSLRLLPQVRAAGVREGTVASFIRLATRGDRTSTLAVASDALDQRDSALFAAVLTSAPNAAPYADELAVKGLAPGVPRDVTFKTIWYVVRTWNAVRPVPARVKSGLEQTLNSGLTPGDPTELLALELAARIVGRPSGATQGWNDLVARPPSAIKSFVNQNAVRALLNDRELESILKGLQIDPGPLQRPIQGQLLGPATASNPAASPPMRAASGFPVGFMSDVFRVTGCKVADAKKTGPGEAVLTFRPDGRPMRVALAPTKASRACADAVRVLMIAHVESVDRIPPEQARVLTLFDADFIACQDVPITRPQQVEGDGVDSRIQQPRKTRHVPPVYPQSAIDQRLQGVVLVDSTIAPDGCISRAEVTRSLDPRLDWAALSAVTGWRFTPTLLNNTPVPVIMTVTVQFSLK